MSTYRLNMETVGPGKCGRRSLENRDGGAWKMGTVELGKWRRRSLENRIGGAWSGDGGAWKMGTVELGFEALCAL